MGHFIHQIVFFMLLGSKEALGLQCYEESGIPEQCNGVCATATALEDGISTDGERMRKGQTEVGCLEANIEYTDCLEMPLKGIQMRVCVCKTDLCNGGGGGQSRGSGGGGQSRGSGGGGQSRGSGGGGQSRGSGGGGQSRGSGGEGQSRGPGGGGQSRGSGGGGQSRGSGGGGQGRGSGSRGSEGQGQKDEGTKGDTQTSSEIEAFFKRPIVIGGIAGGVALIVLIVCIVCCCCDCKKFCIVCC